ncbi:response regulator [Saccharophagus degradans]|uniref:ATP-binding protein n=1 Tax=Saccharophagus degradans TaxID=86304 RepID=UPI001C086EDB|nr:ATP-binding protein [Saccharophagus degradans]MBU2985350.1 response regulator [Saccharophagus degradans]
MLNANTLFAIQFSVLNATALATIAVLIGKHLSTHSTLWMRPLMWTLIIFCIHWLTYPIARHYPTWLQYGLLFGNLVNLATYLTYAMLALMVFQQRLLQAEQTALKNAEKATQSSKAKSEFLANMSHEIRTPINGVLGMLELLKKTSLSEDQQHKVAMALRSGNSLLSIINDILDFSKIEAGKITIEKQAFNIKQLLQDIIETMQHQAGTKGLSVTINTSQIHQDWVVGDESRVRQIVVNLLGNAIKFTERGAVAISASTKMDEQSVQFECEIQDSGIGISSDQAKHLFSAFNQADASTTRKYGGTGLGLVISKKLCTLMGGRLSLESELGRGSTFNFRLTFEKSLAEQPPQAPATTISEPSTAQPTCRILLVEDNEINQLVAEGILEDHGYACDMAENGEIALTMLMNASITAPCDLILMDCQMPIMDGYACTQAIRAGKAGDKHKLIPIIAMTANAMKGDREKCIAAGMDDYLTKPLDEEVFIKMLQQWLPSLTPPPQ